MIELEFRNVDFLRRTRRKTLEVRERFNNKLKCDFEYGNRTRATVVRGERNPWFPKDPRCVISNGEYLN
jgi:hypothetical protein